MPKNRHFSFVSDIKEQNLISDLKQEAIEIYGDDVFYIIRNSVDYNNILGEDIGQNFKDSTQIVVYPENVENFGNQAEFLAKFNFSLQDTTNFLVHRREFKLTGKEYPEVGDLIYWPTTKRLFKITFVDLDYQFYQLGRNSVYQLQCETFKYSNEDFETNEPEVDIYNIFKNEDNVESDPADVDNEKLIERKNNWIVEE